MHFYVNINYDLPYLTFSPTTIYYEKHARHGTVLQTEIARESHSHSHLLHQWKLGIMTINSAIKHTKMRDVARENGSTFQLSSYHKTMLKRKQNITSPFVPDPTSLLLIAVGLKRAKEACPDSVWGLGSH